MGKRAKKAPVQTTRRQGLAKRFKCPFCANEDVVECKMDLSKGVGSLSCRMCSASYQMPIHHLHEPVDVFSEWLDDCEAAERGDVEAASSGGRNEEENANDDDVRNVVHDTGNDYSDDDDEGEEEEDDLPEASGLGQKGKGRPSSSDTGGGKKSASTASGGGRGGNGGLGLDDSEEEEDSDF